MWGWRERHWKRLQVDDGANCKTARRTGELQGNRLTGGHILGYENQMCA